MIENIIFGERLKEDLKIVNKAYIGDMSSKRFNIVYDNCGINFHWSALVSKFFNYRFIKAQKATICKTESYISNKGMRYVFKRATQALKKVSVVKTYWYNFSYYQAMKLRSRTV